MSLTVVCLYIILVLCFILFVNYKFVKLFIATPPRKYSADANSNSAAIPNKNAAIGAQLDAAASTTVAVAAAAATMANNNNGSYSNLNNNLAGGYDAKAVATVAKDVWSIPGPLRLPFFGTKWIYLWKYKLSKIHEVYRGMVRRRSFCSFCLLSAIVCRATFHLN